MENQLQIFTSSDFGQIRAVIINGEPWFVAVDICRILGYTNSRKAINDHVPKKFRRVLNAKNFRQMASQSKSNDSYTFGFDGDETILLDFDSPRGLTFINEAGLYRLVLRSRMPAAEKFTDYVCEVILPTIRKTGSFSLPNMPKRKSQRAKALDLQHVRELRRLALLVDEPLRSQRLIAEAETILKTISNQN